MWQSVPQQLVASASNFFLSKVSTDARAREYRSAVFWLEEAGLITRIYRARKPALPLSADCNFDAYKVSLFDTGLLRAAAGISPDALQSQTPEAAAVRAALNRNALTQSLTAQLKARPAYFETNGRMSADFLHRPHPGGTCSKSQPPKEHRQTLCRAAEDALCRTVFTRQPEFY
nr:hypothetical protein [Duodenibacillus massiliensis]